MTTLSRVSMQYEALLHRVLTAGAPQDDRTGVGTRSIFGGRMRFNLADGFPLVTTKRVHMKAVVHELLWFLSGNTNVRYLQDNGVTIWDEWADENGDLGPVYGKHWRSWPADDGTTIDQIHEAICLLRHSPHSRRNLVTAWNPTDVADAALPPCHVMFQLYVSDGRVSLQVYQRSADMFLGVPFNVASYALLTHMFAQQAGLAVGELIWNGGDCHIYNNHLSQVREQLSRNGRDMPTLSLLPRPTIFDYEYNDVMIVGYDPHPAIAAPVAV